MLGYWDDPEMTAAIDPAGWIQTGDLAKLDRDGDGAGDVRGGATVSGLLWHGTAMFRIMEHIHCSRKRNAS